MLFFPLKGSNFLSLRNNYEDCYRHIISVSVKIDYFKEKKQVEVVIFIFTNCYGGINSHGLEDESLSIDYIRDFQCVSRRGLVGHISE